MDNEKQRREQIFKLYKDILEREPDEAGLCNYLYSNMSIEDIKNTLLSSSEYQAVKRRNNFSQQVQQLNTGELLLMGSTPQNNKHVGALKTAGIKALLNLDKKDECPYDYKWCKYYLNVPLSTDTPITTEQAVSILEFIYTNVVINRRKTFIHSNLGSSRSPLAICLFLMADKKLSFFSVLNILTSKQKTINPSRHLVTGELINFVKHYKFKKHNLLPTILPPIRNKVPINEDNKDVLMLASNLFIGSKVTEDIFKKLKLLDIDIIIDLNDKRVKIPNQEQWCSHIHLPLIDDKIDVMLPVVLKNVQRYIKRGRVYVMCSTLPKLLLFADNFVSISKDSKMVEKFNTIRASILML